MKSLFIFSCLLALSLAILDPEWESFKAEFNRTYENPTEEAFRKKIFLDNKMTIDRHNKLYEEGKVTFTMGINQFSDLTTREFSEQMNGYVMAPHDPSAPVHDDIGATPIAVDWRLKKCVTRVKNQGACGSCWAFATTGSVESVQCVKAGRLVELSEQQLIDCTLGYPYWNMGCLGGNVNPSYQYIISKRGIATEASYPYIGVFWICPLFITQVGASIRSYTNVARGSENALRNAVALQPVAVAIDANHLSFQNYKQGIYYEPACSQTKLNHAVLVVGFGTESGNDYWIVKNSWGTGWGEKGYIRMSRNRGNNCGIATQASYPVY